MPEPSPEVRAEVIALLEQDQSRVGQVYRLSEEGLDATAIAARLGVPTSGFVSNNRIIAVALYAGVIPSSPNLAVAAARRVRTLLNTNNLSSATHRYLRELLEALESAGGASIREGIDDTRALRDGTLGRPGASAIERAGREFKRALATQDSVLTAGSPIWTLTNAQELMERFNAQPDITGSSFDEKLGRQLSNASPGAVQLFAELFALDLLPLADYKARTKRELIAAVTERRGQRIPLPKFLDDAFETGVLNGGVAFKTRRFWQLCYLIEFALGFLAMADTDRAHLLQNPIEFREALDGVTNTNAPSQRATLLYILFPDLYLPIAKAEHRAQIRSAYLDRLTSPTGDIDRDLREIYDVLCAEAEHPIDFYLAPYREEWDPRALSSATYQQTPWDRFMSWGRRISASIDLAATERSYKLEMARRLDKARTSLLNNGAEWQADLRAGVGFGNLLDRYFKASFFDTMSERADELRMALERFWTGEPDPSRIPVLATDLRAIAKTTPGNATALGSVLLMARDSALYPPYRPTPVEKALALTSTPASGTTPAERYDDLLTLCDEVLERGSDVGIDLEDRLDAQGLIWAVVASEVPEHWSEGDKRAFRTWRGDSTVDDPIGRRAWLIRGSSVDGRDLVPEWLAESTVSLAATHLGAVDPGMPKDQLRSMVESEYSFASYAARAEKVEDFHNFLSVMGVGDVVATTDQGKLFVGEVVGEAQHDVTTSNGRLLREVRWRDVAGFALDGIPGELRARLTVQRDVLDLTLQAGILEELLVSEPADLTPEALTKVALRPATAELATELHVSAAWLQRCIDLLNDRPQLIFYGPPGTGKTFIAQRLARHVAGDNVRLVQFHPAYSYEDFFEGFRPHKDGGFRLASGPMRRIVDQAVRNPSVPHVLIIDEINRGNLAKVFGELYFLLEYRDQNVELLYSDGDFSLPKNVFIVATMNTADRSIALVDAAMRRRFAFLPLHPSEPPANGILRSWLNATGRPQRYADLLDELNSRIDDPDFKIGPSYLMRDAVYAEGGLELAWETAIIPLLEEHHYGELDRAGVEQRYGLEAVARHLDPPTTSIDVEGSGFAPTPDTP